VILTGGNSSAGEGGSVVVSSGSGAFHSGDITIETAQPNQQVDRGGESESEVDRAGGGPRTRSGNVWVSSARAKGGTSLTLTPTPTPTLTSSLNL
jgi:hypothetical protein